MNDATTWWLLTGILVAAELTTGSFYLLMLALGTAGGALSAHLGLGLTGQVALAAGLGALSTLACYRFRRAKASGAQAIESNRDVNLDIGETLLVQEWDAHGRAQVHYRGAAWSARYSGTGVPTPGLHRIVALRGNTLELDQS